MTEPQATTPAPAAKPGVITLARHGEPALSRKIRLNADEYREWWGRYELGGLLPEQSPPAGLLEIARAADVIFASERRRAIESATLTVGDKTFVLDPVFIEAPLPPPPLPSFVRLGPKIWGFISRFCWWYFRYREADEETRAQAEVRAAQAADLLTARAEAGQEVLLVAHGFFNTMIGIELKKRGWRRIDGRGWRYWNTRRFAKDA
jgi:broad specificity phosphatase PhoE